MVSCQDAYRRKGYSALARDKHTDTVIREIMLCRFPYADAPRVRLLFHQLLALAVRLYDDSYIHYDLGPYFS